MPQFTCSVPFKSGERWRRANFFVADGRIESIPVATFVDGSGLPSAVLLEALTPTVVFGDNAGFETVIQAHIVLSAPAPRDGIVTVTIDVVGVTDLFPAWQVSDGPRPGFAGSNIEERPFRPMGYLANGPLAELIGTSGSATVMLRSDIGGHELELRLAENGGQRLMIVSADFDEAWQTVREVRACVGGSAPSSIAWAFAGSNRIVSEVSVGGARVAAPTWAAPDGPVLETEVLWPFRLAAQGTRDGMQFHANIVRIDIPPLNLETPWLANDSVDVPAYEDFFPLRGAPRPVPIWRYEAQTAATNMIAELGRAGEGIFRVHWNSATFALLIQLLE